MNMLLKCLSGAAFAVIAGALPGVAVAEDAASLMKSRLGDHRREPGHRGRVCKSGAPGYA